MQDAVFKEPQTGLLRTMFLFGTPLFGVVIEEIEDRVSLPYMRLERRGFLLDSLTA